MNNTIVAQGNDFNVLALTAQPELEELDPNFRPSITWMNMSGDVTITWDDQNKEAILDYARQKMDEGYSFYILKPKKLFGIERAAVRHKATTKNFDKLAEGSKGIVIPDDALNDLLKAGVARLEEQDPAAGRESKHEVARRVKRGEERDLLKNKSLGMKPLVGG